jgi:hypothetical protein
VVRFIFVQCWPPNCHIEPLVLSSPIIHLTVTNSILRLRSSWTPSPCRYDVVYSSAGFNSNGYKAGCAFATGTHTAALSSPAAAKYLCEEAEESHYRCTHDHVANAFCFRKFDDDYLNPFDYVHEGFQPLHPVRCFRTYNMTWLLLELQI